MLTLDVDVIEQALTSVAFPSLGRWRREDAHCRQEVILSSSPQVGTTMALMWNLRLYQPACRRVV